MNYYSQKLSGIRLKKCYDVAPPRIKQYLTAEIEYVISKINRDDHVLELGCGYGRILNQISEVCDHVVGIDIAEDNIQYAKRFLGDGPVTLQVMDATRLAFADTFFDVVLCLQNGISAFGVNEQELIVEALRVTHSGGTVIFSSYSDKIWEERLHWFEIQALHGLVGKINYDQTKDGVISSEDGFVSTTFSQNQFQELISDLPVKSQIIEVDNASIILDMTKI